MPDRDEKLILFGEYLERIRILEIIEKWEIGSSRLGNLKTELVALIYATEATKEH
jgi:hypothetical protein